MVYLVNFDHAKEILSVPKDVEAFVGTSHFASLNAHQNKYQCRGDDLGMLYVSRGKNKIFQILVSLWFTMFACFKPLPWDAVQERDEIYQQKLYFCNEAERREIMKDLPPEMEEIFQCILALGFTDVPNYALIHSLLNKMLKVCYGVFYMP